MIVSKDKLEQVLLSNWTEFVNRSELIKFTLEQARDNKYPTRESGTSPKNHVQISVTKICLDTMELWFEFSVPQEDGVLVGTHICSFSFRGKLNLKDSLGTKLKQHPVIE